MATKTYIVKGCDCCGSEPAAPCICQSAFYGDDGPNYQIVGMSDIYFGPVSGTGEFGAEWEYFDEIPIYSCPGAQGGVPPDYRGIIWDGVLYKVPGDYYDPHLNKDYCTWYNNDGCSWLKNPENGKYYAFSSGGSYFAGQIVLNTALCRWELIINSEQAADSFLVWLGVKTTGDSPAGIYNRIDGGSTKSLVELADY